MNNVPTMPECVPFKVQSGTITLAAKKYGNPANPTVLLVHGYPDHSCVWDGVVPYLAEKYHVVTYDVRGCGESDAPKRISDYKMEYLIGDIAAVIDAVSPDAPVHLVGHDWGSIQSWNGVMDERLKGRIKSYTSMSGISFDHIGLWLRHQFKTGKWGAAFGQLTRSWYFYMFHLPWLAPFFWKRVAAKNWHHMLSKNEGFDAPINPHQLKDGVNGIQLYRANFFRHVGLPKPQPVHCPVQMIVLTQDPYVSTAIFSEHDKLVDDLWRRDIAAAHWLPMKDPKLVAGMVEEFIDHMEGAEPSLALRRAKVRAARAGQGPFGGKQVLITGAGSGIGRSTALAFAAEGADIIATDINLAAAEETAAMVRKHGVQALVHSANVADENSMNELAAWCDAEAGPVDIIVNNAGIGMSGGVFETSLEDWKRIVDINFWGVLRGSDLFATRMKNARLPGHIINIASAAAFTPLRIYPAYAATKAAVLMLSECQHADLEDQGIGVTAVCPGFADTGIAKATEHVGISEDEQARRRNEADAMYKRRALSPDTVAIALVKAAKKNKPVVLVGAEARLGRILNSLLPGVSRRIAKVKLNG